MNDSLFLSDEPNEANRENFHADYNLFDFGDPDPILNDPPGHYQSIAFPGRIDGISLFQREEMQNNLTPSGFSHSENSELGISEDSYSSGAAEKLAPLYWTHQPPRRVLFSNSTGEVINCQMGGADPAPVSTWTHEDGRPVLEVK